MIEIYRRIDEAACRRLQAWLESTVKAHLKPDVSGYARGRMRVWLDVEPSLTDPVRLSKGLPVSEFVKQRLFDLIGWSFDYALVTYSGDEKPIGITPHRDARYADYEAVGLNVSGTCDFSYWEGRKSFGKSRSVVEHHPHVDPPTHSLFLEPGDVIRFNCKNLHSAQPSACRWNINFWRASRP